MALNDPNTPVRTIRASEFEQQKIVQALESEPVAERELRKRRSERVTIPDSIGVTANILQPGGTQGNYLVKAHNISRHGVGFLHGAFVHVGSRVTITLSTAKGEQISIVGKAMRCTYVTNGVHELGVAFDEPFDIEGFFGGLEDDDAADLAAAAAPKKKRERRFKGDVLLVDDSDASRRLLAFLLNAMGLDVIETADADDATRLLREKAFDLVLCDVWLGMQNASGFIEKVRRLGIETPFMAITADERSDTHEAMRGVGCSQVLVKPISPEALADGMATLLPEIDLTQDSSGRLLESTRWGDLSMRPLIVRFVHDMNQLLRDLDDSMLGQGTGTGSLTYTLCMRLGADAAAYGFPSIQSAANTMCMLMDAQADMDEIQQQMRDLKPRVDAALRAL